MAFHEEVLWFINGVIFMVHVELFCTVSGLLLVAWSANSLLQQSQ